MADTTVDTELAYFAGFFDGEGCVAAYPGRYVVTLTNCDPRALLRAKELWGGFVSKQAAARRPLAVRDLWRWQIYGQSSRRFLEDIRPFVVVKSEQIDVFLAVLLLLPSGRGARRAAGATEGIHAAAQQLRMLKRGA